MDDQAFNDYIANVRANAVHDVQVPQPQPQQPQANVTPPQPHSGNWLTHLLPTGGSIGGGLGGAAAGAALGSVVPIIGTGIGAFTGGILGAAFGGGAGKAAENATEGKGIGNGVGTAAVEGGVGQALGGVAGKVLGKGAELLAGRATKVADTAANTALDNSAAKAAENLKNAYADVPKGLRQSYDVKGQTDFVNKLGLDATNPQNLVDTATNANGILNDQLNRILASSGSRDLGDYSDIVKNALAKNGFDLGSYDKVALSKGKLGYANTPAANLLQQLEQHGMGVVNSNSDPNEVRSLIGRLQGLAADAKPGVSATTGAIDPTQKAAYNSINDVVSQLKDRLYNNDAVRKGISELQPNIQAVDVGGNQALADHINGVLSGSKEGQDLLDELSRFTNMNKLGSTTLKSQQDIASPAALARAKGDLNGDGVPDNIQQPSATEAVGSILHGPGGPIGVAGRAISHTANNPTLLNTLSRMGVLASKVAPSAGVVAATAPNLGASPVGAQQQNGTIETTMQSAQQSPLQQLYQTLMDNYQVGGGITPNDASTADTLAGLAPQVQKQNLVSGELSALPLAFANAGGAQGTGGILSRISGLIPGTAAHTYQQQQEGAAQALAAQLGISPQAAMGLLPQLMQNQQTANQNQGVLGQLTGQLAY